MRDFWLYFSMFGFAYLAYSLFVLDLTGVVMGLVITCSAFLLWAYQE